MLIKTDFYNQIAKLTSWQVRKFKPEEARSIIAKAQLEIDTQNYPSEMDRLDLDSLLEDITVQKVLLKTMRLPFEETRCCEHELETLMDFDLMVLRMCGRADSIGCYSLVSSLHDGTVKDKASDSSLIDVSWTNIYHQECLDIDMPTIVIKPEILIAADRLVEVRFHGSFSRFFKTFEDMLRAMLSFDTFNGERELTERENANCEELDRLLSKEEGTLKLRRKFLRDCGDEIRPTVTIGYDGEVHVELNGLSTYGYGGYLDYADDDDEEEDVPCVETGQDRTSGSYSFSISWTDVQDRMKRYGEAKDMELKPEGWANHDNRAPVAEADSDSDDELEDLEEDDSDSDDITPYDQLDDYEKRIRDTMEFEDEDIGDRQMDMLWEYDHIKGDE